MTVHVVPMVAQRASRVPGHLRAKRARGRGYDRTRTLDAAHAAMRRGDHAEAIAGFELVAREEPDDTRSRLMLADLYTKVGWRDQAAGLLREIADQHADAGLHARAISVLKQVLAYEPDAPDVCARLADLYRRQKLAGDARKWVRRAVDGYERAGRALERLRVLRDHVVTLPDAVVERVRLAEAFAAAGRYSEASPLLMQALERVAEADAPEAYQTIAARLLHFAPENVELKRELAERAVEAGDGPRALLLLRGCFRATPDDRGVLTLLVNAFVLLGQPHKARPVLRHVATVCDRSKEEASACDAPCRSICVHVRAMAAPPSTDVEDGVAELGAGFPALDIDWSGLSAAPLPPPIDDPACSQEELVPIELDLDFAAA